MLKTFYIYHDEYLLVLLSVWKKNQFNGRRQFKIGGIVMIWLVATSWYTNASRKHHIVKNLLFGPSYVQSPMYNDSAFSKNNFLLIYMESFVEYKIIDL